MAIDQTVMNITEIVGKVAALATLVFGVVQYRNAQLWRKKELIASEMKAFFADPLVATATKVMDWHALRIELPGASGSEDERRPPVTARVLAGALRVQGQGGERSGASSPLSSVSPAGAPPTAAAESVKAMPADESAAERPASDRFEPVEEHLRGAFDRFCDGLERFEHFVESGLVDVSDVRPYLDYWFQVISGQRAQMDPVARQALVTYMDTYGYRGSLRLIESAGYPVKGWKRSRA